MAGHAQTSSGSCVPAQATAPRPEDEIASLDRAVAALEGQRESLGDEVVETALAPLRGRRAELESPPTEQRRLVTVVFADLVDFTVLSRRLDVEDTREVVGRYFARWQDAIDAQGGVVEKFIGDAVMAVFGLRRSYEDDAHRAVRAALSIIDGLDDLNAEIEPAYGVRLHLRVGIDTGEVVVSTLGERAGHEFVAVGETVNRASRLQGAAPVDGVLVSSDTRRLIRGSFGLDERPGLRLKGIDEPVTGWVVHSERRVGFRGERGGGVEGVETTTVGRDLQLRFLQDRLADVTEESRWRVVTVVGDAGIGKSRLLLDFDAWLAERAEAVWWFRGRASPSTRTSVNALLRDLLSARLALQVDDTVETVRERFRASFAEALGAEGARDGALVASWLGFDTDPGGHDLPTDPQALRDQGSDALGRYFRALAARAPVVVLLEDLHWADEGTLRWLDAVDALLSGARVLVVATARPSLWESRPRWGEGLDQHVRLEVPSLSRRESRVLVGQLLQRVETVPDALVDLVTGSAEGNPFYLEELVTWLIDAGVVVRAEPHWFVVDELVGAVAVPSTLKGVLQSRLDALSTEERDLLQRASVVGRVFWDAALQRLDATAAEPTADLDRLRGRDVVLQREESRFAQAREYLFKHALLRDVAYDGVLRARREAYHRATASWLEETSEAVGRSEEYAAVIAEHFERAHDPAAATWYLRAGRQAAAVFALTEAGELLGHAHRLAPAEDPHLRFDVLLAREALADRVGDRDGQTAQIEEMDSLHGHLDAARRVRLLLVHGNRAFAQSDYEEARRLAEEAARAAHTVGRDDLEGAATLLLGKSQTWADDTEGAGASLARAVALGRVSGSPQVVGEGLRYQGMVAGNVGDYQHSLDLIVEARAVFVRQGDAEMEGAALAQEATTLYLLARFDEARAALEQSLPVFRRAGHRYREGVALGNLASIAAAQGEFAAAARYAEEAIAICRPLEEREAIAVNLLVLAHGELFTGRFETAGEHIEESLAICREVGATALEADALTREVHLAIILGELDRAVAAGRRAVAVAVEAASDLDRGYAHLSLAYALRAAGNLPEAEQQYAEAAALFEGLELEALTRECVAGRARVTGALGDPTGAVRLLEPVLAHVGRAGLAGTLLPSTMLVAVVEVLRRAGDPRADAVLELARGYVRETAARIGDDVLQAGYLAIAPNAALLAAGGPVPG